MTRARCGLAFLVVFLQSALLFGQGLVDPPLPEGTAAAEKQLAAFRLPAGMKAAVFAAEPKLASPVAICLDERGRVFVTEEYRFNRGTEENRTRPFLLTDDLQIRTLDDRLAMFQKFADKFDGGLDWFTKYTDQIRLLEDADGDGRADKSQVFADGFNGVLDGIASGVIARDGDVYVTSIPHLWRLRDTNGDGQADVKEKLLTGFGVNASFLGHDLHGLCWGPDGKLYFSIGDRGFHVIAGGKTHSVPRRGAVFRCQPDGSEFEVVHVGLRNPQELAFDDFGNLFADDNNSDKGDDARLVYIVEGGDSGWNMAFQSLAQPYLTGPWHAEKMWRPAEDDPPAWLLPRVGKIGNGPSGFTYYPGLGLSERYRGHFFMANYTGGGGIESFAVQPKGASFEIVDYHDFLKPIQATDVEFGYDGKMYISDFVGLDWSGKTKGGRIYTAWSTEHSGSAEVKQVTRLFRDGFAKQSDDALGKLLHHADQRVRQRAQFALAARGEKALPVFTTTLAQAESQLARLHALWGLGQIAGKIPAAKKSIVAALSSTDPELLAHAARLAGDVGLSESAPRLIELLEHDAPRVQFFAAQSLGKLSDSAAVEPLWKLLAKNADRDRYLRHAAVYALHRLQAADSATSKLHDPSPSVRLGAVLVLRLARDIFIPHFLEDKEPAVVLEAARAVNDLPLEATPFLAELVARRIEAEPRLTIDPLVRRVINANFRLGGAEHVAAVAQLAANPLVSAPVRQEAIMALGDWLTPSSRDRVTGDWRPVGERKAEAIQEGLPPQALVAILATSRGEVQKAAIEMAVKLKLSGGDDLLLGWVNDPSQRVATRAAALRLLAYRGHPRAAQLLHDGLLARNADFRAAALEILGEMNPAEARAVALNALEKGLSVRERQIALAIVARQQSPAIDAALISWSQKLSADQAPPELVLDLLEAFRARQLPELTAAVAAYDKQSAAEGEIGPFRAALHGGDAERGRALFVNHAQAQCIRCHKTTAIGGGNAGPDLSRVAEKNPREYLLEALVAPNAKIAAGFGSVTLALEDGRVVAGVLKSEQDGVLELLTPQGELRKIPVAEIVERQAGPSPMPAMNKALTLRELRDLVEFLAKLK